jgi:hypothetical protein
MAVSTYDIALGKFSVKLSPGNVWLIMDQR